MSADEAVSKCRRTEAGQDGVLCRGPRQIGTARVCVHEIDQCGQHLGRGRKAGRVLRGDFVHVALDRGDVHTAAFRQDVIGVARTPMRLEPAAVHQHGREARTLRDQDWSVLFFN